MTASIPGENDTKRHRIALAALPSSCQPATLCRRQNPVECRRTECPWYIGRRRPRIILVHARRAAHTREMHGSSDSTKNCTAALVHSADSESILEFFVFSLFSRRNRNQLTERSRLTSRTTYLRTCEVVL